MVLIRAAQAAELPAVQAIDWAAMRMFCDIGMPEIAQYDPWPLGDLAARQQAGRPVGSSRPGRHPPRVPHRKPGRRLPAGRAGIGRSRQRPPRTGPRTASPADQAPAAGLPALTLTTFADVPWNAPYYARCGFRILHDAEITPGLRAIRHHEAALGLDRWPRVCMRRDTPA